MLEKLHKISGKIDGWLDKNYQAIMTFLIGLLAGTIIETIGVFMVYGFFPIG